MIGSALFPGAPEAANSGKSDYYLGLDLYHEKDYQGSIKAFQSQLNKTPGDVSAQRWLEKAREKAASSKLTPAPVTAAPPRVAASSNPGQTDYDRGVAFYREGQYAQATASFQVFLEKNPKHVATRQWLSLLEAHRPNITPQSAAALTAQSAVTPPPALAAPIKGNPQFIFEQAAINPAPMISGPAPTNAAAKPLSFGDKLRALTRPAPAAPAPSTPISRPAVSAPATGAAPEEVQKLRDDLALRNDQIQRAIEQTRRAIEQTDEAEKVNMSLSQEVESLRARQADLEARIAEKEAELAASMPIETGQAGLPGQPSREVRKLQRQIEKMQEELSDKEMAFRAAREREGAATKELEAANNEIEVMRRRAAELTRKIKSPQEDSTRVGDLTQQLAAQSSELAARQREASELRQSLEAVTAQKDKLSLELESRKQSLAAVQSGPAASPKAESELRSQLQSLGKEKEAVSAKLTMREAQLEKMRQDNSEMQRHFEILLDQLEQTLKTSQEKEQTLMREKADIENRLKEALKAQARAAELPKERTPSSPKETQAQLDQYKAREKELRTELAAAEQSLKEARELSTRTSQEKSLLEVQLKGRDEQIARGADLDKALKTSAQTLAEREAELLKLRQDASALQRNFDIRFGQLERTLETAQQREKTLLQEKTAVENQLKEARATQARAAGLPKGQALPTPEESRAQVDSFEAREKELRNQLAKSEQSLKETRELAARVSEEKSELEAQLLKGRQDTSGMQRHFEVLLDELQQTVKTSQEKENSLAREKKVLEHNLKEAQTALLKAGRTPKTRTSTMRRSFQTRLARFEAREKGLRAELAASETALREAHALSTRAIQEKSLLETRLSQSPPQPIAPTAPVAAPVAAPSAAEIRLRELEKTLRNARDREMALQRDQAALQNQLNEAEAARARAGSRGRADTREFQIKLSEFTSEIKSQIAATERSLAEARDVSTRSLQEKSLIEAELRAARPTAASTAAAVAPATPTAPALADARLGQIEQTLRMSQEREKALRQEKTALEKKLMLAESELARSARLSVTQSMAAPQASSTDLDALRARERDLEARLAAAERSLQETRELSASVIQQKSLLDSELARRKEQIARAIEQTKKAVAQNEALAKSLKASNEEKDRLASKLSSVEQTLSSVAASYQIAEDARVAAERRAVEQGARGKDVALRFIAKEKELQEAHSVENRLRETIASLESKLESSTVDVAPIEAARAAAEAKLADISKEKESLLSEMSLLRGQREDLLARAEAAEREAEAARKSLKTSQWELANIQGDSAEQIRAIQAELAESARKYEIASQARISSDKRLSEIKHEFEVTAQALSETEHSLSETNRRLQSSEEARFEAENRLAEEVKNARALAAEISGLRQSDAALRGTIADRERALDAVQTQSLETENRLNDLSDGYRDSEKARAELERSLAAMATSRLSLEKEIQNLRFKQSALAAELEARDRQLQETRASLSNLEEDAARRSDESSERLSQLERILEESRAQGILLANHLEHERGLRQNAEQRAAETRTQIEYMREQLNHTLPQLQALNDSLDGISIHREITSDSTGD